MSIAPQLTALASSGLIEPAPGEHGDLDYLFRHVLIQDAIYQSILKSDRRELHLAVGEVFERLYAGRLQDVAPRLAFHLAEGGDDRRALHYYAMAGDTAFAQYANAEAAMHYGRAVELAQRAPADAGDGRVEHLFSRRGRAMELAGNYVSALMNCEEMDAVAERHDNRRLHLAALLLKGTVFAAPTSLHDPVRGQAVSEQALAVARELADPNSEARAYWNLMLVHKFGGQPERALEYGEQALALARAHSMPEQAAYILNDIFPLYAAAQKMPQALAVLQEALALWRELGMHNMQADCLASLAGLHAISGESDRAQALAAEAWEISSRIHNTWNQAYSLFPLVMVHLRRGEISKAIDTAHQCIRLGERAAFAPALIQTRADLALVYASVGDYEAGLAVARQAREAALVFLPAWRALADAAEAYIRLQQGDVAAAQAFLAESETVAITADITGYFTFTVQVIRYDLTATSGDHEAALALGTDMVAAVRAYGVYSYLDIALHLRSQALWRLGRVAEAEADLEAARTASEQSGSKLVLWQILHLLGQAAAVRGDKAAAEAQWRAAWAVVDFIASQVEDGGLRQRFLQLPEVTRLAERARPAM